MEAMLNFRQNDSKLIKTGQFVLKIGPFNVRVDSAIESVISGVSFLYEDFPLLANDNFADYYVRIYSPSGVRRFWRKQVHFAFDQYRPFKPLPYQQALPFFEWGLNWCISGYAHQYLIIHSAVVEKYGRALILPGEPGLGKSTLCSALVNSGWRLLSDELTLIERESGFIVPVPRPVSLKNESIDLIQSSFPDVFFSATFHDTTKGSVALMKPPADSVKRMMDKALPAVVVFPKYQQDKDFSVTQFNKAEAFMKLAELSFNYPVLGADGFESLYQLVNQCQTFDFVYNGNFEKAINCFEQLILEASE